MVMGSKYRGGQECISSAVLAWNNIYQCQSAGCHCLVLKLKCPVFLFVFALCKIMRLWSQSWLGDILRDSV